jgi:hypothetical protein
MFAANHGLVVSESNGDVRTDHVPGHGRSVPLSCCPRERLPRVRGCRARSLARPRLVLEIWSGAGSHIRGDDVVGVAVEVLAGPVIAHGSARVGVPGGDLDIAQIYARVEACMVVTKVCRSI